MELEKKLKSTTEKAPLPPPHPSHGHDLYLNRGRQHDKHEDRVYAPSKELVVVPGEKLLFLDFRLNCEVLNKCAKKAIVEFSYFRFLLAKKKKKGFMFNVSIHHIL